MIYLLLILTLINVPIGHYLCQRFKIYTYLRIVLVGLVQYLSTAFIYSIVITIFDHRRPFSLETLAMPFALTGYAVIVFSYVAVPIVMLVALVFYFYFRKERAADTRV